MVKKASVPVCMLINNKEESLFSFCCVSKKEDNNKINTSYSPPPIKKKTTVAHHFLYLVCCSLISVYTNCCNLFFVDILLFFLGSQVHLPHYLLMLPLSPFLSLPKLTALSIPNCSVCVCIVCRCVFGCASAPAGHSEYSQKKRGRLIPKVGE